jgi:hypothetical protein
MSTNRKLVIAPEKEVSPIEKGLYERFVEALIIMINKAATPSIAISPAVIGLVITIFLQTAAGIWWAASISKETEANKEEIKELKSDRDIQKVYIDTTREKFIKLESTLEGIQREKQLENMLKEKGLEK